MSTVLKAGELEKKGGGPEETALILSYNNALKEETEKKIRRMRESGKELPENIGVMTYHGLASHYLGKVVSNDVELRNGLQEVINGKSSFRRSKYDSTTLLFSDETQDMRMDYAKLLIMLIRERFVSPQLRMAFVGDPRQLLYSMYPVNYADSRFLHMAPEYIPANVGRPICFSPAARFTKSFRLNKMVTDFVNTLIRLDRVLDREFEHRAPPPPDSGPLFSASLPSPGNAPVSLTVCKVFSELTSRRTGSVLDLVSKYAAQGGKVLVLFNSLNSRSPAKKFITMATHLGLKITVEASGDLASGGTSSLPLPPDVSLSLGAPNPPQQEHEGAQITCKTFHSSKGLERQHVIVVNTKNLVNPLQNDVFVALTRSVETLDIFQDARQISLREMDYICSSLGPDRVRVSVWNPPQRQLTDEHQQRPRRTLWKSSSRVQTSSVFSFMDVQFLSELQKKIEVLETQPATFPLDQKYFCGAWERTKEEENSSHAQEDANVDARAFIKHMEVNGKNAFSVVGHSLKLALHVFFFSEFPEKYIQALTLLGKKQYKARNLANTSQGDLENIESLKLQNLRKAFDLAQEVMKGPGLNAPCMTSNADSVWERLEGVKKNLFCFAKLVINYDAAFSYDDQTIAKFSPAAVVHSTIFRRLEVAVTKLLPFFQNKTLPVARGNWENAAAVHEEVCFNSSCFYGLELFSHKKFQGTCLDTQGWYRNHTIIVINSSLKNEPETDLAVAMDTAVFRARQSVVVNIFDGSVRRVCLKDVENKDHPEPGPKATIPAKVLQFLQKVNEAKVSQKIEYSDSCFKQRIAKEIVKDES